jgi:hypothetical protein
MTGAVSFEIKGNTLTIYDASSAISIKFSSVENKLDYCFLVFSEKGK